MTTAATDEQVKALREARNQAGPFPWVLSDDEAYITPEGETPVVAENDRVGSERYLRAIVAVMNALPSLLQRIEQDGERIEEMEKHSDAAAWAEKIRECVVCQDEPPVCQDHANEIASDLRLFYAVAKAEERSGR